MRTDDAGTRHGVLNLIVAVARSLVGGDVREALRSTDGTALAREVGTLSAQAVTGVRGLLLRCGGDPEPGATLAGLGLLHR